MTTDTSSSNNNSPDEGEQELVNADVAESNLEATTAFEQASNRDDNGAFRGRRTRSPTSHWVSPKDNKNKRNRRSKRKEVKELMLSSFGADHGGRRRRVPRHTPSIGDVPPPTPREFCLNEEDQRNIEMLQVEDEHSRSSRPGAVRVDGRTEVHVVDEIGRTTMTDLTTDGYIDESMLGSVDDLQSISFGGNDDLPLDLTSTLRPGAMRVSHGRVVDIEIVGSSAFTTAGSIRSEDMLSQGGSDELPFSPSSGDIMAQAELVNNPVVVAAALDRTDELRDRIAMLEEAKAHREGWGQNDKARKLILCSFALLLILAGATVASFFFLAGKRSLRKTEAPSPSPTIFPTAFPTQFPSQFPTQFPTPLPTVDLEEFWTTLIQSRSPSTTFDNTTSPEYQTLEWMVEDPLTKSLFNNTNRVLQRFVLALFWYATGASLGGGWLSDTDECTWGGTSLRCDFNDTLVGMSFVRLGLTGTIPKEIALLSALTHLALDGNDAIEGTIPTEIGQLTALTLLDLTYTGLEGSLPSEIGLLTVLETIYLGQTSVGGTLPTEVGMMSLLDFFAVYDNKINGTIPSELGLMTAVTLLDISENALTGTIPSEVANLTKIESFQIYGNQNITGTMPSDLCSSSTELSIDCGSAIECTCCTGPWPNFEPCEDPSDVFGGP